VVQTASHRLPASGRFVSLCGGSLGTDAARGDGVGAGAEGGIPLPGSWGFAHALSWALLRVSSSAWDL